MKALKTAIMLALLAAAPAAGAEPDGQVVLRGHVVVNSDFILLGDIFTGAGDKAETPVAYTPAPGKRAVFDARWLSRVARAYGLNWRPAGIRDQTIVKRESFVIGREEIEDVILAALIDKGVEPGLNVELSNRILRLHVAGDSTATVAVEDTVYEPRTKRFTAIIVAPADDPSAKRIRVTGRLIEVSDVPVLARRVMSGEFIGKGDIEWIKVRSTQLQRGHHPRCGRPRPQVSQAGAARRQAGARFGSPAPVAGFQEQPGDHRPAGAVHVAHVPGTRPRARQRRRHHPGRQHPEQQGDRGPDHRPRPGYGPHPRRRRHELGIEP